MATTQNGTDQQGSEAATEPIRGEMGGSILGPRNVSLEAENPSLLRSPATDAGSLENAKFPFASGRNRLLPGGWAREVTTRDLPVATELAGVNMRLTKGGTRELHWHKEAEWSYMIAGRARVTAIDPEGRTFVDDVGVGDLWYFPPGIPHAIQGLDEEGCEFLLVFDDGGFSENETFLITDWFAHTPPEVLAKNFGVPESAFANLPGDISHSRYISRPHSRRWSRTPSPAPTGRCRRATPTACSSRRRSRPPADACASPTRRTSPSPRRSPPRWSRSSPVECARCTGTPTPTSGSTTSPEADA